MGNRIFDMKKTRLFPILLSTVALLSLPMAYSDEDDNQPSAILKSKHPLTTETGSSKPNGQTGFSLVLSPDSQQKSGLKTKTLAAFSMHTELLAYGRVLDIRPLLELRSRHHSAQSELAIAEAALRVARKNHDRLENLHRASIIATKELIQAEAQLASDQARQEAALRHIREIREEALQAWGETLCKLAVESESRLLQNLLKHSSVLVLIALPANQSMPLKTHTIGIAPTGEKDKPKSAHLLAPAPKTDEATQGETWFFEASSDGLRTGMRLDANISLTSQSTQGVLIPSSAIVWHEGQPWVFLRTGVDRFVRHRVGEHRELGEDWFVNDGFAVDEVAVVGGAQMLLSEEQRHNATKSDETNDD